MPFPTAYNLEVCKYCIIGIHFLSDRHLVWLQLPISTKLLIGHGEKAC